MGKVQNGLLYIRYRSSSQKNKAGVQKPYKLHPLAILSLDLHVLNKFHNLSQSGGNQTINSNFVHLFPFLSHMHNSKVHGVCTHIHTKWLLYYSASSFSGLERHTSYNWQAIASKLFPKTQCTLARRLYGLLFTYSGHGTYSQATPRILNACITGCNKLASNQLWVSRSLTIPYTSKFSRRTIITDCYFQTFRGNNFCGSRNQVRLAFLIVGRYLDRQWTPRIRQLFVRVSLNVIAIKSHSERKKCDSRMSFEYTVFQNFVSLIFADCSESAKTAKIMRLENLDVYGSFFFYLALKTNLVQPKTLLCI